MIDAEILFACGYTDGKDKAISKILSGKKEIKLKEVSNDEYGFAYKAAYQYYLELRQVFRNNQEYLMFLNNNEELLQNVKETCFLNYKKAKQKIKKR